MNLSATVACITNNYRPRNIYTVNQNATSYDVKRNRRKRSKRASLDSSTSTSRSSSIIRHALTDPSLLYEISSRDCPCDHHRLSRLRESQRKNSDVDSLVINTFEASVAPFREFLTRESSTTGDSGVNTNSNGSQRSSGRLGPFHRTFSWSSGSANSENDNEVIRTTTVILEHHGCEDQHSNNSRAHQKSKPFQISPTNDPSQNWTMTTPQTSEENCDSLFSSLKTSHSSSLKELCTCHESIQSNSKHPELQRVASYPKAVLDPHRFELKESKLKLELKHLPTVPPSDFWSSQTSKSPSPERLSEISGPQDQISNIQDMILNSYQHTNEIPPCVRNVILQQLQNPTPPPQNPKMIKKLSRTITLPEDPSDPTAFTIPYDQYLKCKSLQSRSRRSRQVIKIVGTFSFLMTMGIVITVLLCLYWSDTFKPMTMT